MNQVFNLFIGLPSSYTYKKGIGIISGMLTESGVEGFTLIQGTGYCQGKPERCIQAIVIDTRDVNEYGFNASLYCNISKAITDIKQALKQDCILLTISESKAMLQ